MSDSTDPNKDRHGIVLSQRQYDTIKDLDLIALPGLGTAYGTLATLYHWGYQAEVVGTIGVVIFLLGILLKISNVQYQADAKVRAIAAANIVDPVVTVNPDDATKVEVTSSSAPPTDDAGFAVDPTRVEVTGPSQ